MEPKRTYCLGLTRLFGIVRNASPGPWIRYKTGKRKKHYFIEDSRGGDVIGWTNFRNTRFLTVFHPGKIQELLEDIVSLMEERKIMQETMKIQRNKIDELERVIRTGNKE